VASNTIVKAITCTLLLYPSGTLEFFRLLYEDGMKSHPCGFSDLALDRDHATNVLCCLSKVARKTESCAHHTNLHCRLFIMQASVLALTITHNVLQVPFSLISVLDNG
jgi:hypothetical protein